MGFKDNVRHDLRLRNLTIYAQWTSVVAALLLCFPSIVALYAYLKTMATIQQKTWTDIFVLTIDIGPMLLLYPLPPLAVELPHYIRPKSLLYISMMSWLVMPARYAYVFINNMMRYGTDAISWIVLLILHIILLVPLNIAPLYVISRLKRPGLPGLGAKFGLNMLYFVWFVFPAFSSSSVRNCLQFVDEMCSIGNIGWFWSSAIFVYVFASCVFGFAALLYGIARRRQHPWVSSTVLGGTGIEAMVLTLPGPGPSHQSVGDEARTGAIRL